VRVNRINKKDRRVLAGGRSRMGDKLFAPCLPLIISGLGDDSSVLTKTLCITIGFCNVGRYIGVQNA